MRIAVIGTGVAGSLLAEALAPTSHIVEAFERARPGDQDEAGTGLNLGPNALKALRLYALARHAAVRAASIPWARWTTSLADGRILFDLDIQTLAEEPGARIRWAELYRVLRAPIHAEAGMALAALEEDAAGRLVPVFRHDEGLVRRGAFDLVVGADGRYSQTRIAAVGAPEHRVMGVAMWRLLVADGAHCPFDDFGQWFNGPNRLLAYRLPGGAVYVAGAFPLTPEAQIPEDARTAAAQRALFTPPGAAPCPAVAWMLDAIDRDFSGIHWARSQVAPMLRHALDGRVLFLGDAAHSMVPTLGQGATQAVEDGLLAAAVLARGGSAAEVSRLRDGRVAFVRDFSDAASDTLQAGTDPVAGGLAKATPEFHAKLHQLWTDIPPP